MKFKYYDKVEIRFCKIGIFQFISEIEIEMEFLSTKWIEGESLILILISESNSSNKTCLN